MKNNIITNVVKQAFTEDNYFKLLDIIKENVTMSALNQALIYLQEPDAGLVCSKSAWQTFNRAVNEDAKPIVVYFPSISITDEANNPEFDLSEMNYNDTIEYLMDSDYDNNYVPVNVFSVYNTVGNDIPEYKLPDNFIDIILKITQVVPEFVGSDVLGVNKGVYDKEENAFYISEDIDIATEYGKDEYTKLLLKLYIDYVLMNYSLDKDPTLSFSIQYILYERYHIKHNIAEPLFVKLFSENVNYKYNYFITLQFLISGIIQDIEGAFLNFNETAIVNSCLFNGNMPDVWALFDRLEESIDDELLKEDITILRSKLSRIPNAELETLYKIKSSKKLYSFPPYCINVDTTDYLREARNNFLSNF